MSKKKKVIHLLCNAHIDPVWLWEWQEGAAEAISTFRTAAEFCENNETFVFNHNEAILYKWVEEYEPALFKRIVKLVKQGKWHIMGGWHLQPDCNMPSGESFVRQILSGKNYFRDKFSVEPKTAINFDPFGHTRGLVQILAKSGYDSYLFGRPRAEDKDFKLADDEFIWVGFDGSEILAHRFEFPYGSPLGRAKEKLENRIENSQDNDLSILPWGVGNHGGGPSRKDLENINKIIEETDDFAIKHSTPEAYFKASRKRKNNPARHYKGLNPWAVGCYSSQIRIKQKHRLLENEFFLLEKMASCASINGLMDYPREQIDEAMYDLMTIQFHDTLPGSSIEPVEEAALVQAGHGLEIVSRLKAKAFFALASGQKKTKEGEIPILVYNPHPFKVTGIIECDFGLADPNPQSVFTNVDVCQGNKSLPCQVEHELSNAGADWRKRVAFIAELKPSQMNRFDCKLTITKKPKPLLKVKSNKITFKTKELEVVINASTGLIDKYKVRGRDYLNKGAFGPIVIGDNSDPWGMTENSFRNVIGSFKLMNSKAGAKFSGVSKGFLESVRVIEDGNVRSVVEVVLSFGDSFICQRYKLPKTGTELEVEIRVHWNEKDKMLKMSVPMLHKNNKYIGQVAYGVEELPDDGTEAVSQKWVASVSRKNNAAVTFINDGIYSSDFSNDELRLTLLRSPAYSAHPDCCGIVGIPQDRYSPRADQGQRVFRLWLNAGGVSKRLSSIDREALVKNERVHALSFFPSGAGNKPKPLAILDDDVVQMTAFKKSEKGNCFIVRLFEPTGKKRSVQLSLPVISKKMKITLDKFEIKTLKINLSNKKVSEVDLLEKSIRRTAK